MSNKNQSSTRLAIIVPVHNEEESLTYFYERICLVLEKLEKDIEPVLFFINNNSTDNSLNILKDLHEKDKRVQILSQSRNFGYQGSLACALTYAKGDIFVVIDADCEDPPEMIETFVKHWREGYDIVYGLRQSRPEPKWLITLRKIFYRLTNRIADWEFIIDMAEFSLFTDRVRKIALSNHSTYPFIRSELAYAGFTRKPIVYTREKRRFGETHYNLVRMTIFALGGIFSSSTFLLRLITYVGIPLCVINFLAAFIYLFSSFDIKLLMLLNMGFLVGSFAFLSLYTARIIKDLIGRPVFIVDRKKSYFNEDNLNDTAKELTV